MVALSGQTKNSPVRGYKTVMYFFINTKGKLGKAILDHNLCIPQTPTDGFAEQNGRDAERAD